MKKTTTVKTIQKGTTSGTGTGGGSGSVSRYVSSKTTRVISGGSGSQSGLRHSLRGSGAGKLWKKTVLGKKYEFAEKLKEKKNYLMYHSGMGHEKNVIEEFEQIPQPEEKEKIIEEREIIDNYGYYETKNLKKKKDPKRLSITHHERLSTPFERTVVKKFSSHTSKPQQRAYTTTIVKKPKYGEEGINKYNSFTSKQEQNKTVAPTKLYETYKPNKNISTRTETRTTKTISIEKKQPVKTTINQYQSKKNNITNLGNKGENTQKYVPKFIQKQKPQNYRAETEPNRGIQTNTRTTQDGDYLIKITTTKKQVTSGKPYGDQKPVYKSRDGSLPRTGERPRNIEEEEKERPRSSHRVRPEFRGPHGPYGPGFGGPHGPGFGGPHGPHGPGFGGPHGPHGPGFGGPHGPHGPFGVRPHGPFGMPHKFEKTTIEDEEDLLRTSERPKSLERPNSFGRPGRDDFEKYPGFGPHGPRFGPHGPGFGPEEPGFGPLGPGFRPHGPGFVPFGPGFGGRPKGFGIGIGPNGEVIHLPTCPFYRAKLEAERRALSQQKMITTYNEKTFSKTSSVSSKSNERYRSQQKSRPKTIEQKKISLTTTKKTTSNNGGNKTKIQEIITHSSEGGDNYNYYESKEIHKKRRNLPITIHHKRGELGAYIDDIPERHHHQRSSSFNKTQITQKTNLNNTYTKSNIVRNLNKPKVTSISNTNKTASVSNTNKTANKNTQKKSTNQQIKTSTTSEMKKSSTTTKISTIGTKKATDSAKKGFGKSTYSEYRKYEQKGKVGGSSTGGSSTKYKMKSSSDYKKGAKTTTDTTTKYQYNKTEYKKEVPMYGSREEKYQFTQSKEYYGNNMKGFSKYQYFDENEYEIIDCPVHGRQTIRKNKNYNNNY